MAGGPQRRRCPGAAALALAAIWGLLLPAGHAAEHTVVMEGNRFEPESLTVRPGDAVRWINRDPFPHTATARSGGFDSRRIEPGKSWRFTPTRTGTIPYFCAYHPSMLGSLRVE